MEQETGFVEIKIEGKINGREYTIQDVDISELQKELEKGSKVEHEHTNSEKHAKRVAMDHLVEDPKYYTKLSKAGL